MDTLNLRQQETYQKCGVRLITQGLDMEVLHRPADAHQAYERGLEFLRAALALNFSDNERYVVAAQVTHAKRAAQDGSRKIAEALETRIKTSIVETEKRLEACRLATVNSPKKAAPSSPIPQPEFRLESAAMPLSRDALFRRRASDMHMQLTPQNPTKSSLARRQSVFTPPPSLAAPHLFRSAASPTRSAKSRSSIAHPRPTLSAPHTPAPHTPLSTAKSQTRSPASEFRTPSSTAHSRKVVMPAASPVAPTPTKRALPPPHPLISPARKENIPITSNVAPTSAQKGVKLNVSAAKKETLSNSARRRSVATPEPNKLKNSNKSIDTKQQANANSTEAKMSFNIDVSGLPEAMAQKIHANAESLKSIEPHIAKAVLDNVLDRSPPVNWDSLVGLESAKTALKEMIILPHLNPSLFQDLRAPPRGLLLFGPPGNGKTMLAKAAASQSSLTFFLISASALSSKWHGESEKLMRALFALARALAPSIIFIDEIDSVLSARTTGEQDVSRRSKTEFMTQFEAFSSGADEATVVVVGATNRPWDIDDAVLRRLTKRIFIPLPTAAVRQQMMEKLLSAQKNSLTTAQLEQLANTTESFSASDIAALCKDAAFGPIRDLDSNTDFSRLRPEQLRPISLADFTTAMRQIRPSASKELLKKLDLWNAEHGSM